MEHESAHIVNKLLVSIQLSNKSYISIYFMHIQTLTTLGGREFLVFNATFNNRKPEYQEKTTDLPQVTEFCIKCNNFGGSIPIRNKYAFTAGIFNAK